MITVKDYATKRDTTTQAIYKLIKKHSKELEGHIIKQNGVKVIDEKGEEYLDSITNKNPIVPINQEQKQRIEELEKELQLAKDKVMSLQEEMRQKDNFIIGLQQNNQLLLTQKGEVEQVLKEEQQNNQRLLIQKGEVEKALKEEKNKKWWEKIFK